MSGPTPEHDALAEVLLAASWPDGTHDGFPTRKVAGMLADALLGSPVLADTLATARADALRDARDALYRGDGPDLYADADLIYGEWLGNRADRAATEAGTDG